MNCNNAENYFMKYMDNILEPNEAEELNSHIKTCDKCKEEFLIYNMMLEEFSAEELVVAPEGFELKVMEKIRELPEMYTNQESRLDNVFCVLWGVISGFFGIGALLMLYKQQLISFLSSYAILNSLVNVLKPVSDFVSSIMTNTINYISVGIMSGADLFTNFRFHILIVIILVAFGKIIINRGVKIPNK